MHALELVGGLAPLAAMLIALFAAAWDSAQAAQRATRRPTASSYRARAGAAEAEPRRTALIGRATASSDLPAASTPRRISTTPPIAMITPPITNAIVDVADRAGLDQLPERPRRRDRHPVPHA